MTDRELRKASRRELLQLLVEEKRENDMLRDQLQQLRQQLDKRQLQLDQSGTLAEAALKLSGIFEAAQAAADQYLENIGVPAGGRPASGREEE